MKNEPLTQIGKLKQKLTNIEAKLNKNRPTVQIDGRQTQRYAKKARNWDMHAQEKMKILQQIEFCESNDYKNMCTDCDCCKRRGNNILKYGVDRKNEIDPYRKNKR